MKLSRRDALRGGGTAAVVAAAATVLPALPALGNGDAHLVQLWTERCRLMAEGDATDDSKKWSAAWAIDRKILKSSPEGTAGFAVQAGVLVDLCEDYDISQYADTTFRQIADHLWRVAGRAS